MRRRDVLAGLCGVGAALALRPAAGFPVNGGGSIRIGLTPVFLDDQAGFLQDWKRYLEQRLERPVEFVQRGSYREIVELVLQNQIQFAWVCGYPYVRNRARMKLLAVPAYRGQPLYESYLIVPVGDQVTANIEALRGKVFAYSDPDSNSGFLVPQYQLRSAGLRPQTHFRRSFFTYSHRNVVEAVGARVAHGGAVDGYVWDTLKILHPDLVAGTRVVLRSPQFGFPPMVAAPAVSGASLRSMQSVLFAMHSDREGLGLLRRLNLDRFEAGVPALFDGIEQMARKVEQP
jgi:phosphonate transport system substrate-binding protein